MRWLLAIIAAFWVTRVFADQTPNQDLNDPYSSIEHIRLENGVNLFLAPSQSASNVKIKIEVDTGIDAESRENWGVAHLLEHVLFRDKELQDEMSFLQLIKENGGSANGSTQSRITDYFATIPSEKGVWLFETLTKMILDPQIRDEYVLKEKATVELERGRPSPIAKITGHDFMEFLNPRYLQMPTFNESEFGVNLENPYSLAQEQLATQRLTTKQVRDFYKDYYHSANMRVFVAGKFDRAALMRVVEKKWAKLVPTADGKRLRPLPVPRPRSEPYVRSTRTDGTPYITIGTKLWDLQNGDVELVDSYMEFLAHRLMKELRNKKGQTYSASAHTSGWNRFGYSVISMQTSRENFAENLEIVKEYIEKEARLGALTGDQVAESKRLYLDNYRLVGKEADDLMSFAERYYETILYYGTFTSPYQYLKNVSVEEYNSKLKSFFNPDRQYVYTYAPSLFFEYDWLVMSAVFAITAFVIMRKLLTRPFAHDRLRWIRKVKYPPIKSLELFTFAVIYIVFLHAAFLMQTIFLSSSILQSNLFLSQYVYNFASILLFLGIAQSLLSYIPRKLMVVEDRLVIKSLSYFSWSIALNEITSVEAVRPVTYPFPVSRWIQKVGLRLYWFDPNVFRKGIIIHRNNGRSYFFSVSHADKVAKELSAFLPTTVAPLKSVA